MSKITLNLRQLHCLKAPIRLELLRALIDLKTATVSQMAQRIQRSPATTIYHLRILQEAGLAKQIGKRPTNHKPESIYAPVALKFELPIAKTKTLQNVNQQSILIALRHTSNLFKKIRMEDGHVFIINRQVRLSKTNLNKFHKMLEEANAFADKNKDPKGKLSQHLSIVFEIPSR